jgi:hypothetical protein
MRRILSNVTAVAKHLIFNEAMRLWVDDERPAPDGWYWATTAPHAIWVLQYLEPDEVSLDHDLGDDGQGTGYDVAKWLEEQAWTNPDFCPPLRATCHSANPTGRERINAALASMKRAVDRRDGPHPEAW